MMLVRDTVHRALCDFACSAGVTASSIAAYLHYTEESVRSALRALRLAGRAKMAGLNSAARWAPDDFDGEMKAAQRLSRSRDDVLAAMRKIGRFARLNEIIAATTIGRTSTQRAIKALLDDGTIVRVGRAGTIHSQLGLPGMPPGPKIKSHEERAAEALARPKMKRGRKPKAAHVPWLQKRVFSHGDSATLIAEAIAAGRVTKCPPAYVGVVNGATSLDPVPSWEDNHTGSFSEAHHRGIRNAMKKRDYKLGPDRVRLLAVG